MYKNNSIFTTPKTIFPFFLHLLFSFIYKCQRLLNRSDGIDSVEFRWFTAKALNQFSGAKYSYKQSASRNSNLNVHLGNLKPQKLLVSKQTIFTIEVILKESHFCHWNPPLSKQEWWVFSLTYQVYAGCLHTLHAIWIPALQMCSTKHNIFETWKKIFSCAF